jgi:hypothetical protein
VAALVKPEPNLDVKAWEKWTRDTAGVDEPARLHRIFQQYCATRPRSLRVALSRFLGLEDGSAAALDIRVSGALYRASQRWSWRRRADELDKHLARIEKAAFDAAKLAARRRRLAQLDRLSDALGLRLEEIAERATLEGLLRLHTQEREEYAAVNEDEHDDVGLPALEDRIKPPDHDPKGEPNDPSRKTDDR